MAKTLTTPISVTNNVANINKWVVVDYRDHTNDAVPSVEVLVQAQGGGKAYGLYWLHAWDLQNSLCLTVNTASVSMDDQLSVAWRQLDERLHNHHEHPRRHFREQQGQAARRRGSTPHHGTRGRHLFRWGLTMSYVPNLSTGGVAQMTEYANALSLVIDQVNTYHPLWTAGVVAGLLDGWTFSAGLDGSYTAVANLGGGQVRVTTAAPHGMAAGRIVALTSSSVAGYQPPNPTVFKVTNVNSPTTFDVVATFTTTATGFWTAGAASRLEPQRRASTSLLAGHGQDVLWLEQELPVEPLLNVAGSTRRRPAPSSPPTVPTASRAAGSYHRGRRRRHHVLPEPDRRD